MLLACSRILLEGFVFSISSANGTITSRTCEPLLSRNHSKSEMVILLAKTMVSEISSAPEDLLSKSRASVVR